MAQLSHIIVPVSNMENSLDFYTNKLGFTLETQTDNDGMQIGMLSSSSEDTVILISNDEISNSLQPGARVIVGWLVGNLDDVGPELEKKGITFNGPITELAGLRIRQLNDPDGHAIQLTDTN